MNEPMRLLTDEELIVAFQCGHSIDEPAYYYIGGYQSISQAQLALDQQHEQARVERIFKEIETLLADNIAPITFIRQKDNKASVEQCLLLMNAEWQALKKQEGIK